MGSAAAIGVSRPGINRGHRTADHSDRHQRRWPPARDDDQGTESPGRDCRDRARNLPNVPSISVPVTRQFVEPPELRGAAVNDPLRSQRWDLDRLKAEDFWPRSTGQRVNVAVIDTGVGAPSDLAGVVLPGADFRGTSYR